MRPTKRVLPLTLALAALFLLAACGGPTVPTDSRYPPAVGAPGELVIGRCSFGTARTSCQAVARWGLLYTTEIDVTAIAAWSSDASAIVAVAEPGVFVARGPGDAHVTANYLGVTATASFRVYQGESVAWQWSAGSYTYIRVVDTTGHPVEGAKLEVTSVHNFGLQATSDSLGTFTLRDVVCGPMTVRATKDGYLPETRSFVACVDGFSGLFLTPAGASGTS